MTTAARPIPLAPLSAGSPSDFIRIEGLSKGFKEGDRFRSVLQDAQMSAVTGEFVTIAGRSGSGKSTLLNIVSGIERPDGGTVSVGGVELTSLSERDRTLFRRLHIGIVFQFFNLIPTLSVVENVLLPLELAGRNGADSLAAARNMLLAVGLSGRENSFPDRLSGGEQQRVAIARALVHDPLLVLADEPTGNLDESTGHQILALLDQLTRRAGKNLLLVTHGSEGTLLADRVLRLKDGRLVDG